MDKKRTVMAAAIVLLIGIGAALSGGGQVRPQTSTTQMQTTLKTAPPPEPIVTAWGPKDKVATGEIIWIQGTNLQRDLLVMTLGDRNVLPHLYFEMTPAASSTATRVEFRTTAAMKTGVQTSSPLKVLHRGGKPVVLVSDYHVVDRRAKFNGISKYHYGETSAHPLYSEGTVRIELDNLDFANQGTGIYQEQVRLIRKTKEATERCPDPNPLGLKKTITYYDWFPYLIGRNITWKRDPAVPSRIVLYSVGLDQNINATADISADWTLQCGFIGHFGHNKPYKTEHGCGRNPDDPSSSGTDAKGPSASIVQAAIPPPLTPAPPTYVIYSLRRAI